MSFSQTVTLTLFFYFDRRGICFRRETAGPSTAFHPPQIGGWNSARDDRASTVSWICRDQQSILLNRINFLQFAANDFGERSMTRGKILQKLDSDWRRIFANSIERQPPDSAVQRLRPK